MLTEPITTKGNWGERKKILAPLQGHCLCCLERERDENGAPTLGFIRPRQINKLIIEQDSSTWTEEDLAKLRQDSLFELAPKHELEKLPFTFKYHFFCDHDGCSGHKLSCTDWEMGELFRKCRNDYGADWEPKFRERYEADMTEKNDTHFFVGTLHGHPNRWIIIGLFYPPKPVQKPQESLSLFDP